ncbi:MAG: hypothetical protein HQK66_01790 [Desulfamplus sp.]|nr:hypothetical protein [Desulfamplus sp.]
MKSLGKTHGSSLNRWVYPIAHPRLHCVKTPSRAVVLPGESVSFRLASSTFNVTDYNWQTTAGSHTLDPQGNRVTFTAPPETGKAKLVANRADTGETGRALIYVVDDGMVLSPVH